MKRHTIFALFICAIATSCNKKETRVNVQFSDIFKNEQRVVLPDTLGPKTSFYDAVFVGESTLFFSDRYTKRAYKYDLTTKSLAPISNIGNGPNHLASPTAMVYSGDTLYVGDYSRPYILKYSKTGDLLSEQKLTEGAIGIKSFAPINNTLYKLNFSYDTHYLSSLESNQSFFSTPPTWNKYFTTMPKLAETPNHLVFMNNYENILFRLNKSTLKEDQIAIKNLNTYNWENDYSAPLDRKVIQSRLESHFQPYQLYYVGNDLLLLGGIPPKASGKKFQLYFIDLEGNIRKDIDLDEFGKKLPIVVAVDQSKLLIQVIDTEKRETSLHLYSFSLDELE